MEDVPHRLTPRRIALIPRLPEVITSSRVALAVTAAVVDLRTMIAMTPRRAEVLVAPVGLVAAGLVDLAAVDPPERLAKSLRRTADRRDLPSSASTV